MPVHVPMSATMPVLRNGRGAVVGRVEARGVAGRRNPGPWHGAVAGRAGLLLYRVEARGVAGRRDNPGPWRGAVAGRVGLLAVAGRVGLLL